MAETKLNTEQLGGNESVMTDSSLTGGTNIELTKSEGVTSINCTLDVSGKQDTLVSGTNIKTVNNNSLLGSGNISIDSLPSQSGNSGKFLTTNGSSASWATAPTELPSQSGQSGKFLTTNGTTVSWAEAGSSANAYTADNLKAGAGIVLTNKNANVLTSDDIALWHLDGTTKDVVGNLTFNYTSATNPSGKFADACMQLSSGTKTITAPSAFLSTLKQTISSSGSLGGHVSFWVYFPKADPYYNEGFANEWSFTLFSNTPKSGHHIAFSGTQLYVGTSAQSSYPSEEGLLSDYFDGRWHKVSLRYTVTKYGSNYATLYDLTAYIDGEAIRSSSANSLTSVSNNTCVFSGPSSGSVYFSELLFNKNKAAPIVETEQFATAATSAYTKITTKEDINEYVTKTILNTGLGYKQNKINVGNNLRITNADMYYMPNNPSTLELVGVITDENSDTKKYVKKPFLGAAITAGSGINITKSSSLTDIADNTVVLAPLTRGTETEMYTTVGATLNTEEDPMYGGTPLITPTSYDETTGYAIYNEEYAMGGSLVDPSTMGVGSGDFTLEAWVKVMNADATFSGSLGCWYNGGANFYLMSEGFSASIGDSHSDSCEIAGDFLNKEVHIAFVRKDLVLKIYLDGQLVHTSPEGSCYDNFSDTRFSVQFETVGGPIQVHHFGFSKVAKYLDTFTPSTDTMYKPELTGEMVIAANIPTLVGADGSTAGTAGLVPAPAAADNTKYLCGDGTWKAVSGGGSSLPDQTGQSGKFLTTDGTDASWATVSVPTVDQTYGSSSTNAQSGTAVAQAVASIHIPTLTRTWYTGNTGKTITIASTASALTVGIYRNGVLLQPTEDYSISGTTLTLVGEALSADEKITLEVYA